MPATKRQRLPIIAAQTGEKRPHPAQRPSAIDRLEFFEAMKSRPCADCGGRFPPCAMEFDHVRGEKVLCVGNMKYYGADILIAEIRKCDLVCSNCHAIRTHERRVQAPAQPVFKATDWSKQIVIQLPRVDALQVGQTLRSLARERKTPPGVRDIMDRVGSEFTRAAMKDGAR